MALPNNRSDLEYNKFVETAGGDVAVRTTAQITGDINVDSTSVDTSGYIGKASGTNGDFITAYASATTLTCTTLPSGVSSLKADDIVTIVQVATNGSVTNTYSRDDMTLAASGTDPTTLTITGATFVNSDTFIVYTNIQRPLATSADSEGTIDSAHGTGVSISGGKAESTVPTEVADADAVANWMDTFGRQILFGTNLSTQSVDTSEVAPALLQTVKQTGITQLTAPGDTADINVEQNGIYGYAFTVAAIDTTVVVSIEGSVDGTNFAVLPLDNSAVVGGAITTNQLTITVNGTYVIYSSAPVSVVHLTFESETGGTAATIDADFFARRK